MSSSAPIPIEAAARSWRPVRRGRSSAAAYVEQRRQNPGRVEMVASDFAGPTRVGGVRAVDAIDAGQCFFLRRECEQPLGMREMRSPPCVLDKGGPPRCEITLRAIAEPSRAGGDVGVFGDAELRFGQLNEIAIVVERT